MVMQTKKRRENDALQACHWTISLLKPWLLGTHAGAVREKHLQAYLDEFASATTGARPLVLSGSPPARHRAARPARAADAA
jgi:hypothetical protein